ARLVYIQRIRPSCPKSLCYFLVFLVGLTGPLSAMQRSRRSAAPAGRLQALDSIVQDAIGHAEVPGAVVLVGHNGTILYRKAFGYRSLQPQREAMTADTIFDIASLTKVVGTTTAIMQLLQQGKLRLNDPVGKYLPEFAPNGKEDITVRQLLTHFSGL